MRISFLLAVRERVLGSSLGGNRCLNLSLSLQTTIDGPSDLRMMRAVAMVAKREVAVQAHDLKARGEVVRLEPEVDVLTPYYLSVGSSVIVDVIQA
jgi:hypothetical protein